MQRWMYPWAGRFALFVSLILLPAVLFLVVALGYAGNVCYTLILLLWLGIGIIVVEELLRKRSF